MLSNFIRWLREEKAVAAIEAGFIFPLLMTIMLGTSDTGVGLVTNQKMINSCQMIADLLAREEDVNDAEFEDAYVAGRMSMQPYDTATFGADVVGIIFLGEEMTPTEDWRDVVNTVENNEVFERSEGLGREDEGVIAVTVNYRYEPFFTRIFTDGWTMQEVSFVRGRKGLHVTRTRG